MAFLLWRLPAGGRLVLPPRSESAKLDRCAPPWACAPTPPLWLEPSAVLSSASHLGLCCGCTWLHGAARLLLDLHLALCHHRTRGLGGPKVVARATTKGPRGIGEQTPPSSSLDILPPRPGPCNPQPLLWAGRFRLSPRAKGRGSTREATTRNIPRDQQQPRFFLQDLQV